MATENVLAWLEQDGWPLDLYDLFGRWIFDPDLGAMRTEVALAARELLPYQSHANPQTAQRAMKLLTEHVGRASAVLSNPEKLHAENARILESLRGEFAARHGGQPDGWDRDALQNWLVAEARVHPEAAEDTTYALLGIEKPKPRVSVFGPRAADVDFSETGLVAVPEPRPAAPPPLPRRVRGREKTCPMCGTRVPERFDECSNCAYDFTASQSNAGYAGAGFPRMVDRSVAHRPAAGQGTSPAKLAAIISAAVAVPLTLLIAVVIWIMLGNRGDSDGGDKVASTNVGQTNNGIVDSSVPPPPKPKPDPPKPTPKPDPPKPDPPKPKPREPLTKRKLSAAVASLGYAHWKKLGTEAKGGPAELEALLNALELAPNDEERAEIFAYLAYHDGFLKAATFADLQAGIDALSKSVRHYSRIGRLAARLATEQDVLALINLYVGRLQQSSFDAAAQRALREILSTADAMKRLSVENIISTYERAHRFLSGAQRTIAGTLTTVIVGKKELPAALKRCAAGLSSFTTDKAAADLTAAVLSAISLDRTRFPQISRDDIFAAWAALIRTASTVRQSGHAGDLLRFAEADGVTTRALTYFRGLFAKNANDPAALAVLSRHANDQYDKALRLSGAQKVSGIDAAIALAPTTVAKQALLYRASSDLEYMRRVGFDRGIEIHEALVARYLPPNPPLKYSASFEAGRLMKFAESRGKLSTVVARYRDRLKKDPKDAFARELYNAVAVATADNYTKSVFNWGTSNYAEIDRRLKDFDNEARAAAYARLIINYAFKRGLTTARYLAIREEIIGAASEADRPAAIRAFVLDVPYGMPMPPTPKRTGKSKGKTATPYVSTSVPRWDAAVKYFRGRTRQNNIVSIPNLYVLHALLKARTVSTFYYHPSSYVRDVAADRKEIESVAAQLLRLTGKSP